MKNSRNSGVSKRQDKKGSAAALCIAVILSFMPGLFGSMFRPDEWYEGLVKPALNPPGWIFGPVWTLLYITMGVSAWLVWRQRAMGPVHGVLLVFAIQLLLNGLWSYLFFGLQKPDFALMDILFLWAAIACTLIAFWQRSKAAGLLLIPYLAWVSFAVYLNFQIWRLNISNF